MDRDIIYGPPNLNHTWFKIKRDHGPRVARKVVREREWSIYLRDGDVDGDGAMWDI